MKDPSGAVIGGAEVTAMSLATNVETKTQTTAAGEYNIPVSPGDYKVTVTATGFKRYERDRVTVSTASTVRLDAELALGGVNESIIVTSELAQLQTETAKISTAVQNRMVDELPLVVGGTLRTPFDLVSVVPEARSGTTPTLTSGLATGQGIALGGGQAGAWDATMDGLSVTTNRTANQTEIGFNSPSVEAITEFTVDTNGFKAEFGQAGGGVITFTSKSGTNEVHGDAYDFLRNDDLDARGFFAPYTIDLQAERFWSHTRRPGLSPEDSITARTAPSSFSAMKAFAIGSVPTARFSACRRPKCTRAIFRTG